MRRRMPFVAAAFLLTVLGYFIGYYLCKANPANVSLFFPEGMRSSMDAWKQGFADHGDISIGEGVAFSSMLMTHNTEVGIMAFAYGITVLLPIYLMLVNGWMMGSLVAVVEPTGHLTSMWAGILPHGICELSAIFICGGAGFLIGWSLIAPGQYSRFDAPHPQRDRRRQDDGRGPSPLFIIAGILEGNVSHSSIPHWAKFTLAATQFLALTFYIYGAPIQRSLKLHAEHPTKGKDRFSPAGKADERKGISGTGNAR